MTLFQSMLERLCSHRYYASILGLKKHTHTAVLQDIGTQDYVSENLPNLYFEDQVKFPNRQQLA